MFSGAVLFWRVSASEKYLLDGTCEVTWPRDAVADPLEGWRDEGGLIVAAEGSVLAKVAHAPAALCLWTCPTPPSAS